MTVSSPEFDLIFGRIDAQRRSVLTKLDRKIARKELRIAGIFTDDSKQTERS